jgi:SHS family lactate transporter-like MFS transporter
MVLPNLGWRWMFWIGGVPALLALYIRSHVPESEAWKQHRAPDFSSIMKTVAENWKLFAYLLLFLTLFTGLSHGTQDLYPDFLRSEHGILRSTVANIAILYNIGAVLGAIIFGHLSEKLGRRYSIVAALLLALCTIPFWAYGYTVVMLAAAAFFMQVGVQGAWGIVPAHINELVPDSVRGLLPGMAYQLGVLFGAPTNTIEYALRDRFGYQWALAGFEISVILLLMTVTLMGTENKGKSFVTRGSSYRG